MSESHLGKNRVIGSLPWFHVEIHSIQLIQDCLLLHSWVSEYWSQGSWCVSWKNKAYISHALSTCGCVGIRVCTFLFPCSPWPTSPINPASSIHDPTSFITGYDWEKSPLNEGKAATRLYPKRVSKGEWPYKQPRQQKSLVGLCNPATREKPQAQGLWEWFV